MIKETTVGDWITNDMDLKTRVECLPCGACEYMNGCDDCYHQKVAKNLYQQIRAEAIDEVCKQISERVEYWDSCAKAMEKGSNEYKIFISLAKNFDELAEQLKEQK